MADERGRLLLRRRAPARARRRTRPRGRRARTRRRPGSIRYAAIIVSSAALDPRSAFASCAATRRLVRAAMLSLGRGATMTSSAGRDRDALGVGGDARRDRRARRSRPRASGTVSSSAVGRSAAGSASSSVSTRPSSPRNSKRRKISFSSERSGGREDEVRRVARRGRGRGASSRAASSPAPARRAR